MPAARKPSRPTIVQVARRAGVSIKTVSRVSNGEPNVRPEVRERVAAAIRSLNYHPSLAARSLAGRRSYLLLFHPCDARGAGLAEELLGLAIDPGIEGLILSPPLSARAPLIERLAAKALPLVLIAPPIPAPSSVFVDDEAAAAVATRHLIELGHRRIGFICGHPDHAATAQRQRGHEEALRGAGLSVDPQLIEPGEFSFDSGRAAAAAVQGRPATAFTALTSRR